MGKQNNLDDILKKRNPLEGRQIVKPVDVLKSEQSNRSSESNDRTEHMNQTTEPNRRTERTNRTGDTSDESERPERSNSPNAQVERSARTVFDELEEGTSEETKRQTERYSFEIYTDQKGDIEEVQYLYKKKTGKKLSASRIIREALEEYLTKAKAALRQEERE